MMIQGPIRQKQGNTLLTAEREQLGAGNRHNLQQEVFGILGGSQHPCKGWAAATVVRQCLT